MAGDWIKMRADLFTHPKVVRISSALKADTLRTVGGLMSAWCLFDAHSDDGRLEGYSPEVLDAHLRWDGFAAAMIAVGWLEHDPTYGLALPRFDTHNGQSAKRRAQDADRKREFRKASAPDADILRTREEKRREEVSIPNGIESGERKSPAHTGTRLHSDWELPQDWHEWASKERPDLNPSEVAQQFKDHWLAKPGRDGVKADWFATFRNWVRREKAHQAHGGTSSRQKFNPTAYVNDPTYKAAWDGKGQTNAHGDFIDVEAQRISEGTAN